MGRGRRLVEEEGFKLNPLAEETRKFDVRVRACSSRRVFCIDARYK